jgi:hypothetical protein
MISNILHYKSPKKEKQYLSVKICCIVDELPDANDESIKRIRDYCLDKNVIFETRVYDSYKYTNDRHFIRILPAFHLYVYNVYERTFYPNTRPYQHINEGIQLYIDKIEKKRKRKEDWEKYVNNFKFKIRYVFGLTSLMQRQQNLKND